jgi:hypothetical protein
MIKDDWNRMVKNLEDNNKQIVRLIAERNDWKFKFVCEKESYEKDVG